MVASSDLLRVWEEGAGRPPVERSLLAFALARPDLAPDALLDAPVGERDAALLALRIAMFGARADAVAACPACDERLDLPLDLRAFFVEEEPAEGRAVTVRDLIDAPGESIRFREHLVARTGTDDPALLAARDPQADLLMDLACPGCGAAWQEPFDPAGFLWLELEDQAGRLLGEVHALARAYGWSETEILALSPSRRAAYLALTGAV